jgi:hypothetical protein
MDALTQYSLSRFFQCIDGVNQLQCQPEMLNLLIILRNLQEESLGAMNKATSQELTSRDASTRVDFGISEKIRAQFRSIKDRNH